MSNQNQKTVQNQVQNQAIAPAQNPQTQNTIATISPTNSLEVSNPISAVINSQSPTAIIIAIALLISILIGSITKLVYVILILINKPPK